MIYSDLTSKENPVDSSLPSPEQSKRVPFGRIHSVETFGSVDGPGIRFIVFLKGCAMRCRYCHNPDTWDPQSDDLRTADEVLEQALHYRSYWGRKGGITASGGEALLQIDFLTDLFRKAKAQGVNTCLDTAARPFTCREPFFGKVHRSCTFRHQTY